jgi:hypothetical protein
MATKRTQKRAQRRGYPDIVLGYLNRGAYFDDPYTVLSRELLFSAWNDLRSDFDAETLVDDVLGIPEDGVSDGNRTMKETFGWAIFELEECYHCGSKRISWREHAREPLICLDCSPG